MTHRLSCCLALGLLIAACDGGNDNGIPIEDVPEQLGDTLCQTFGQCLGLGSFFPTEPEACQAFWVPLIRNEVVAEWQYAIDRGTLTYDPQQVQACIEAYQTLGCQIYTQNQLPLACRLAAQGLVQPGGACQLDVECEAPARCEASDTMCPGVCVALRPSGAACLNGSECENSLDCFQMQCAPRGLDGQPCGGNVAPQCAQGLFCRGEDFATGTAGSCTSFESRQTAGLGEQCERYLTEPVCETGLFCVAGTAGGFVCQGPVTSGAACRYGENQCPSGDYCAGASQTNPAGTCTRLPALSEPCPEMQCALGSRCIRGTCLTPEENGASCTDDSDCYSLNCIAGICGIRLCE